MNTIIGELFNRPITIKSNKQNKWELTVEEAVNKLGGSSNSSTNFKYFKYAANNYDYGINDFITLATLVKFISFRNEQIEITPKKPITAQGYFILFSIDMNAKQTIYNNGEAISESMADIIKNNGFEKYVLKENEITEEEFWKDNFTKDKLIAFGINGQSFTCFEGMTWGEVCGTDTAWGDGSWSSISLEALSSGHISVSYGSIGGGILKDQNGNDVIKDDVIIPDYIYIAPSPGGSD
jgi:hypothetical protein